MRTALRTAAVVAALGLTLAGCVARESASDQPNNDGFTPSAAPETSSEESPSGSCEYQADGTSEPAVGLPPTDGEVEATSLALTTSAGPITVALDAERAPCTVRSMVFLAGEGYFNDTICHRLTTSEGLKVLQCGDPAGNGTGGPGYVVPDELPEDLQAAQDGAVIYPRGIVAMANGGPGTTGSQFFLVYGDSTLPPNYTVIGTVDEAGLATLDQIAEGGVAAEGGNSPEDGPPTTPVTITAAVAS